MRHIARITHLKMTDKKYNQMDVHHHLFPNVENPHKYIVSFHHNYALDIVTNKYSWQKALYAFGFFTTALAATATYTINYIWPDKESYAYKVIEQKCAEHDLPIWEKYLALTAIGLANPKKETQLVNLLVLIWDRIFRLHMSSRYAMMFENNENFEVHLRGEYRESALDLLKEGGLRLPSPVNLQSAEQQLLHGFPHVEDETLRHQSKDKSSSVSRPSCFSRFTVAGTRSPDVAMGYPPQGDGIILLFVPNISASLAYHAANGNGANMHNGQCEYAYSHISNKNVILGVDLDREEVHINDHCTLPIERVKLTGASLSEFIELIPKEYKPKAGSALAKTLAGRNLHDLLLGRIETSCPVAEYESKIAASPEHHRKALAERRALGVFKLAAFPGSILRVNENYSTVEKKDVTAVSETSYSYNFFPSIEGGTYAENSNNPTDSIEVTQYTSTPKTCVSDNEEVAISSLARSRSTSSLRRLSQSGSFSRRDSVISPLTLMSPDSLTNRGSTASPFEMINPPAVSNHSIHRDTPEIDAELKNYSELDSSSLTNYAQKEKVISVAAFTDSEILGELNGGCSAMTSRSIPFCSGAKVNHAIGYSGTMALPNATRTLIQSSFFYKKPGALTERSIDSSSTPIFDS